MRVSRGIEPEYRESVFDPFQRLNPASDYPGSGLGLSICRRLLASIESTIAFEDRPPDAAGGVMAVLKVRTMEPAA